MSTPYHTKYSAYELSRLGRSLFGAAVDLNFYQMDERIFGDLRRRLEPFCTRTLRPPGARIRALHCAPPDYPAVPADPTGAETL